MTQAQLEFIQLTLLGAYVLKSWKQETILTCTVLLWWMVTLNVDIFLWHCTRPAWMQWGINSLDMLLGWIVIYEKYRLPCKKMLVALVGLLSSLVN